MRTKISAVRYWHLLAGFPDFSKRSDRYKQVLKSVGKGDVTIRNYPFNLELPQWVKNEVVNREDPNSPETKKNHGVKLFAILTAGFFYLLRVSEIENIRTQILELKGKAPRLP